MRPARAARLFVALDTLAILFQLLLAAGLPWGEYAWGGAYPGTLPPPMRIASACSALLLGAMGAVVLIRAGVIRPGWRDRFRAPAWFVTGYFALGMVANAITPSAAERMIWLPVAAVLFGLSLVVARQPRCAPG